MSTYVPIEWEAWRSEDTEPNSFYTVYGATCRPALFQASTTRWRLQAATSQRLIVFAPEGLPPIALSN
jgi:hypothetical protein